MIAIGGGFYMLAGAVSPLFFGGSESLQEVQVETN